MLFKSVAKKPLKNSRMNRTEAEFGELLHSLKSSNLIRNYLFESYTFRLADRTTYTPDFCVIHLDGLMEFVEVKGFWRDDARVKFKVTAELFPWHDWTAVSKKKKEWKQEKVALRGNSGPGILTFAWTGVVKGLEDI